MKIQDKTASIVFHMLVFLALMFSVGTAFSASISVYPVQIVLDKRAAVLNLENKGDSTIVLTLQQNNDWIISAPKSIQLAAGQRGRFKIGRNIDRPKESALRGSIVITADDNSSIIIPVIVPSVNAN